MIETENHKIKAARRKGSKKYKYSTYSTKVDEVIMEKNNIMNGVR